jgi:DNA-binding response OmpR family regulator
MSFARRVLLVSQTTSLTRTFAPAIQKGGYDVVVSPSFAAAKGQLRSLPDLLITELKLSEYNGLQLVLRGQALGIPALVVADQSFEREIERVGAIWVPPHVTADELQAMISESFRHPQTPETVRNEPACGDYVATLVEHRAASVFTVLH